MTGGIAVVGYGMVTAVGLSSLATCAAIRAAISGFAGSSFFQDSREPVPLVVARVPLGPPPEIDQITDRLVRMAVHALHECFRGSDVDPERTVLLLGAQEPFRNHVDFDVGTTPLVENIQRVMGVRFHPESTVLSEGNAAVFRGLDRARTLLESGTVEHCVVGGVDSYLNPHDLQRFEDTYRLKREGVPQGFIPGEGAAFVVVSTPARATPAVEILGLGLAQEDPAVTVLSDGHPTGKGLRRALDAAILDAGRPESDIDFRVSDLNGEYYRGLESVLAQSRFYRAPRQRLGIWVPAACVGETGAAVGALSLIVASVAMAKGYAPGSVAMCEASSDTGLRAGCLIGKLAA